MGLDLTEVVPIYQENIDALINQLGKDVVLHFKTEVSNVTSDFNDFVRDGSLRLPDFKKTQDNPAPVKTETTKTIKALLQIAPGGFANYNIRVEDAVLVMRLKTFLTDVPDLKRCSYIVAPTDAVSIVHTKFRLIREPVATGLKVDRYAISFWEAI